MSTWRRDDLAQHSGQGPIVCPTELPACGGCLPDYFFVIRFASSLATSITFGDFVLSVRTWCITICCAFRGRLDPSSTIDIALGGQHEDIIQHSG